MNQRLSQRLTPRHLIHVGYPKTGSTFLQNLFGQHPELNYAPGGLGGVHDVYDLCRRACQTVNTDHKYVVTSCEGLIEPSIGVGKIPTQWGDPGYAPDYSIKPLQKNVCQTLKTLFHDCTILIVTRGFKSYIRSSYSQYVRAGGTRIPQQLFDKDSHPALKDLCDFDYVISLYADAFGEENVIVLPYELLQNDQARFLSILADRLDVKAFKTISHRVNPALSPEELYWYPRISRYVSAVARRIGTRAFQKTYSRYVKKTLDNGLRRPIKILSRLKNGTITEADFPWEFLPYFKGQAERLRRDPLYAPYAKEYLWED